MPGEPRAKGRNQTLVPLPDFTNLGVLLRTAVIVEGTRLLVVLITFGGGLGDAVLDLLVGSGVYECVLLSTLFVLFVVSSRINRLTYRVGGFLVVLITLSMTLVWHVLFGEIGNFLWWQECLAAILLPVLVLWYFNWRYLALSPALSEARLMALQARIRPHFLFNSLNTVLGLIRVEPKRAEVVLVNLAELYRALLSEVGSLVPLARELELARGYAEIETMRLGERLNVQWQCQDAALNALVPPLIVQPLLENAIYHGVEPSVSGGEVAVSIFLKGDQLNLVMRNTCDVPSRRQGGNRMALANIRERLDLHFDAEGQMSTYRAGGEFVVQIRMPYRHG